MILTTPLCSSVTWFTYRCHIRLHEHFHQSCLRSIINIPLSAFVKHVKVLEHAGIPTLTGQDSRMVDHRLPWIIVYCDFSTGHRERGIPMKRYEDCLKSPTPHARLTRYAGQTCQWTMMTSVIRSSM